MLKMNDDQKRLVEDNIRLAGFMTQKWIKRGTHHLNYDDIFSMFSFALCKAAKTFDPNKGVKFATYAARCMENEIKMAFRRKSRLGGESSEIFLGAVMNCDDNGNEVELIDVLSNNDHMAYDKILDIMYTKEALMTLKPREFTILQQRFFEERNQRYVADHLGLSQSYISRVEKAVLKKLRDWDKDRNIC